VRTLAFLQVDSSIDPLFLRVMVDSKPFLFIFPLKKNYIQMSTVAIGEVVGLITAPVVLITACGLLLGSLNSRLASCIARTRQFDERVHDIIQAKMTKHPSNHLLEMYNRQIRSIRNQGRQVIKRAENLRNSVALIEICSICMILTSLVAALTLVNATIFTPLTLAVFIIGGIFLFMGVLNSVREVLSTLGPVEVEFLELVELSLEENGDDDDAFGADDATTSQSSKEHVHKL
jgi:hypothetical protein